MEPLAALGLAGNIVNFIDFAINVVSKGNHIYHSSDGTLSENLDLELITNDMLLLQNKFQLSSCSPHTGLNPNDDEKALNDLFTTAGEAAHELLAKMNMVKVQGRFRRWKSLRQAIKSVSSKKEVDDLKDRLSRIKEQIQTRLMVALRHKLNTVTKQTVEGGNTVQQILDRLDSQVNDTALPVADSGHEWLQSFQAGTSGSKWDGKDPDQRITQRFQHFVQAYADQIKASKSEVPPETLSPADLVQLQRQQILSTFASSHTTARDEAISKAHAKTYSWIFEDINMKKTKWSSFPVWLQRGSGIYWIHGKAASGKSTLMKHITNSPRTRDSLEVWAGQFDLVLAKFFFWNLGSDVQKSQGGLVASLVHQILSQQPSLIENVLPDLWNLAQTQPSRMLNLIPRDWYGWKFTELEVLLENALSWSGRTSKWCIFIDGLDEFDGEHEDIILMIRRISTSDHVKVCVSSRPLIVFEDEYRSCPQLRLQDLTAGDIQRYVYDNLAKHRVFEEVSGRQPEKVQKLLDTVLEMSSGVFLWVILVVKSLRRGLANRDEFHDLETRLRQLPSELGDYFDLMLRSIQPEFYLSQGSRLFQIVFQAGGPISALMLSFSDEIDSTLCLSAKVGQEGHFQAETRLSAARVRIKTRTAGLLEVSDVPQNSATSSAIDVLQTRLRRLTTEPQDAPTGRKAEARKLAGLGDYRRSKSAREIRGRSPERSNRASSPAMSPLRNSSGSPGRSRSPSPGPDFGYSKFPVQYLHLTVRDFLEKSSVWSILLSRTKTTGFDSHASLARGSLLSLKYYLTLNPGRWDYTVTTYIKDTVKYAAQAEMSTATPLVAVLDELDQVCSSIHGPHMGTKHWASGLQHGLPPCQRCPTTLLQYFISQGLTLYVQAKLGISGLEVNRLSRVSLLSHATIRCAGNYNVHRSMVAFLLKYGLDPSEPKGFRGLSPWEEVLGVVAERVQNPILRWSTDMSWPDICKLYLMYGADPKARGPHGVPAGRLLLDAFCHLSQRHFDELKTLLHSSDHDHSLHGRDQNLAVRDC